MVKSIARPRHMPRTCCSSYVLYRQFDNETGAFAGHSDSARMESWCASTMFLAMERTLPHIRKKSEFYRPGGAEMPRSLQIFCARNVFISLWRGTVLMNSFDGFRNTECFAPSRTNRHLLRRRC